MNRRLPRSAQRFARPRRRPVVAAAISVAAALTLSGCQYTSTIQTDQPYVPADGISAQIGDLQVRNLLIVSGQKNGPGNLVGLTANPTDKAGQISFAVQGGKPVELTVPAQGSVQLSTPQKLVPAGIIKVIPGALVPVQISSASGGATVVQVPVEYPQGPYQSYAPEGWTPKPKPAPSATG